MLAQEPEERTFTQAEVDKIVQKRIARVEKSQAELEKSIREKVAAEQDEDRVRVILRDAIEHIEREFARKATAIAKEEAR